MEQRVQKENVCIPVDVHICVYIYVYSCGAAVDAAHFLLSRHS